MWSIFLTLSLFQGFLGFGSNPSLNDITNRFGNPVTVEQSEDKSHQAFTFARESYLLTAISNNKNKVKTLMAYGLNKSVKYKGVGLMSDFKSVIKKLGKPEKYIIEGQKIEIIYPDCVFTLVKIGRKNYHQVVGISVSMNQVPTQSAKK